MSEPDFRTPERHLILIGYSSAKLHMRLPAGKKSSLHPSPFFAFPTVFATLPPSIITTHHHHPDHRHTHVNFDSPFQ
ncbi:hypothetical protein IMZ48_09465 [Candidatus Bathyarchaeota archaeon]|nr:hypothetical protein [Candidatus Bathyarchaeota archaeon]